MQTYPKSVTSILVTYEIQFGVTSMRNRYINLVARLIVSIILAYPLSAVTLVIVTHVRDPMPMLNSPMDDLRASIFTIILFGILKPIGSIISPFDHGVGNDVDMIPYMITTTILLFMFLLHGWYKKYISCANCQTSSICLPLICENNGCNNE